MRRVLPGASLVLIGLLLSACGGSDGRDATRQDTAQEPETEEPAAPPTDEINSGNSGEFCALVEEIERNHKSSPDYPGLTSDVEELNTIAADLPDVFGLAAFGFQDALFDANPTLTPKESFFQLNHACEEFG